MQKKSSLSDYLVATLAGWGYIFGVGLLLVAGLWLWAQLALFNQAPKMAIWLLPLTQFGLLMLLSLPSLALIWFKRGRLVAEIGKTWLLAAGYGVLLLPVQALGYDQAQRTALLQLLLTLLFLAGLRIWGGRDATLKPAPQPGGALLAGMLGVLYGLPWLLFGAFGSLLDSVLNVAVAIAFGWAATQLLQLGWLRHWDNTRNDWRHWMVLDLVLSVQLFLMAIGLGAHGQQLFLMFCLPAVGWLAGAVLQWGQGNGWNARYLPVLLAVVAAAILLTIDPDEQNLILGDTFSGVFQAVALSVAVGWLLGGLLLLLHRAVAQPRSQTVGTRWVLTGLLLLTVALAAVAYTFVGQPGFHGERYFVILKEQADLSAIRSNTDYADRRTMAYQLLTSTAQRTQAPLIEQLRRWRQPYSQFYLVNALEVPSNPLLKWWLLRQPAVARVLDSPQLRPLAELTAVAQGDLDSSSLDVVPWGLNAIQAVRVHDELGVRGAGIVVGESDSGVAGDHSELADGFRAQLGWYDPWFGTQVPTDLGGHGTHTTGTILGNKVGVAPDAQWIGCVNLARNLGNPALYVRCLEFVFAPFAPTADPLTAGQPTLGAHVLNNSWGCPLLEGCDPLALQSAVQALTDAGVFVVAAAGNDGSNCSTITDPIAIYADTFTVGAIDANGDLASFSSRGPVQVDGSGRLKPDLLAPGVNVFSAMPNETYTYNEGTSMASPHVTGVVALMWSANPALIGQIEATADLLRSTASPYTGVYQPVVCGEGAGTDLPNNSVGAGVVDAYEAVKAAQAWHK